MVESILDEGDESSTNDGFEEGVKAKRSLPAKARLCFSELRLTNVHVIILWLLQKCFQLLIHFLG